MFRFLADENFNSDIVRGLRLRTPNLDLLRVQEVGLAGADDPAVLSWAAEEDRILLTHDRATMPDFAYERGRSGLSMPGVFVLSDRLAIGIAVREIELIIKCSSYSEWRGRVEYLPL